MHSTSHYITNWYQTILAWTNLLLLRMRPLPADTVARKVNLATLLLYSHKVWQDFLLCDLEFRSRKIDFKEYRWICNARLARLWHNGAILAALGMIDGYTALEAGLPECRRIDRLYCTVPCPGSAGTAEAVPLFLHYICSPWSRCRVRVHFPNSRHSGLKWINKFTHPPPKNANKTAKKGLKEREWILALRFSGPIDFKDINIQYLQWIPIYIYNLHVECFWDLNAA